MAKKPAAGAPAWMATFADLMSLLLVLFVLLLTFAEMDVIRYKQVAGSIKAAFGFSKQDELAGIIELDGSIVGKAIKNPTPDTPRVVSEIPNNEGENTKAPEIDTNESDTPDEKAEAVEDTLDQVIEGMGLSEKVEVDRINDTIVMRFPNELAFPSGTAGMTDQFIEVLDEIAPVINQTDGDVQIAGHTDNVPVSANSVYTSNWDLSAARATSVLHHFIDHDNVSPQRLVLQGYGDSRPLGENDTPEGRAKNRRVEIIIKVKDVVSAGKSGDGNVPARRRSNANNGQFNAPGSAAGDETPPAEGFNPNVRPSISGTAPSAEDIAPEDTDTPEPTPETPTAAPKAFDLPFPTDSGTESSSGSQKEAPAASPPAAQRFLAPPNQTDD